MENYIFHKHPRPLCNVKTHILTTIKIIISPYFQYILEMRLIGFSLLIRKLEGKHQVFDKTKQWNIKQQVLLMVFNFLFHFLFFFVGGEKVFFSPHLPWKMFVRSMIQLFNTPSPLIKPKIIFHEPMRSFTVKDNHIGPGDSKMDTQADILLILYVDFFNIDSTSFLTILAILSF